MVAGEVKWMRELFCQSRVQGARSQLERAASQKRKLDPFGGEKGD